MQRKPKKLKPIAFIHGILQAVSNGEASFRLLATAIGMRLDDKISVPECESPHDTLSKQALWERVGESAVDFFKATLEEQLKSKGLTDHTIPRLPSIRRIIVEDSSKIDLPDHLAEEFPSSRNQTEHEGAGLRLQGAFELISGEVIRLELTEYYRQDTTASADILPLLQPNDLVLRDLGYLVSDTLNQIMEKGVHFLSRYRIGRPLYHCAQKGGEEINLMKYLKKHAPDCGESIDLDIVMGCPESRSAPQVKCRMVAVRLPDEVVEKRLRQVNKEDKRRGRQRSEESKQLLGWTILITSLPRKEADVELLMELYPLRWRVEIIFKSLKSYTPGMALANHRSNADHIQVLLYAWLSLTVVATKMGVFALAKNTGKNSVLKPNLLSLLKVMPKVFEMFRMVLYSSSSPSSAELLNRWLAQCEYHDQYEKRNKRTNMAEMTADALGFDDVDDSMGSDFLCLS